MRCDSKSQCDSKFTTRSKFTTHSIFSTVGSFGAQRLKCSIPLEIFNLAWQKGFSISAEPLVSFWKKARTVKSWQHEGIHALKRGRVRKSPKKHFFGAIRGFRVLSSFKDLWLPLYHAFQYHYSMQLPTILENPRGITNPLHGSNSGVECWKPFFDPTKADMMSFHGNDVGISRGRGWL